MDIVRHPPFLGVRGTKARADFIINVLRPPVDINLSIKYLIEDMNRLPLLGQSTYTHAISAEFKKEGKARR